MRKDEVFPSRFFKAGDLDEPITLTIAHVGYETLKNHKGNEEQKLVVGFKKTKKSLVVNVTNFDAIVDVTGEADSDDWPNHTIQLYGSEVQVGAKMVPCVRVRTPEQATLKVAATKKKPSPAKVDDDMDDAIPY